MIDVPFLTKLILPRRRTELLARPHLLQRLHKGLSCRLQLVSCGAGYGKTTLLGEFARNLTTPVCWLSLDRSDEEPRTFLTYLLAGLQRALPALEDGLQELYETGLEPSRDPITVVGRLVTLLHSSGVGKLVVILDDLHTIEDGSAVQKIVAPLVERAPEMLHIVVGTRVTPRLTILPRLMAQREASVLGEKELRLSVEEVGELLTVLKGHPGSPGEAQEVAETTQGWTAGVVLCSLAGEAALPSGIAGPGEELFRYLAAEVLDSQPPAVREFLLQTSVLDELTPEACSAVTRRKDSERVLGELERRNVFLTRVAGETFQYHQLFRSFLRDSIRHRNPAAYARLNLEAGRYLDERGQVESAVDRYLNAGETALAARAISRVAKGLFDRGQWHTLARLIDSLPGEVLDRNGRLLLMRGQVATRLSAPLEAVEFLDRAVAMFEGGGRGRDLVDALMARSAALRFQGAHQPALKDAGRALTLAKALDAPSLLLASAHRQMAMAYAHAGLFRKARRHFVVAVRLVQAGKDPFELALAHGYLANAYVALGELPRAATHYRKASEIWRRLGNLGELATTLNNLAVLLHTQGQFQAAQQVAAEAVDLAQRTGYTRSEAIALLTLGDVHLALGEYPDALESYTTGLEKAYQSMEAQAIAYGTAALGECHRLLGDHQKSAVLLRQAEADARSREQPYELGLYLSSLGALARDEGDLGQSAELLQRACSLLDSTGYRSAQAVARFHLAHTRYLQRRHADALKEINTVSALCAAMGSSAFLLPQARHAQDLLQYAALRGAGRRAISQLVRAVTPRLPGPTPGAPPALGPGPVHVEAFAFGPGTVRLNSNEVSRRSWASAKARELLFFLLLRSQRSARKEEVMAALWPDSDEAEAGNSFHAALHRLRAALLPDAVLYRDGRYLLNPAWNWRSDDEAFQTLLKEASRHLQDNQKRSEPLRHALALYKAPLLEGCYSEWCEELRHQREEQRLSVLLGLAEHQVQQKDWRGAAELYEQAWRQEPFQEQIVISLMRCHARLGDHVSVFRTYERYCSLLKEGDADAEPSVELTSLLQTLPAPLSSRA